MSLQNHLHDRFVRLQRGLWKKPGTPQDTDSHCRDWLICNYIEGQMASRDSLHSEATNSVDPELPPSPLGFTREVPPESLPIGPIPRDTHLPDCYRDASSYEYGLREAHIRHYVVGQAPGLFDLLEQPPPHVSVRESRQGYWSCPACEYVFCPYSLGPDELANLDGMGVWDEMVVHDEETGDFGLDSSNPWRFLRYLDALAWQHIDGHMRELGMRLTFPDPRDCRPQAVEWWLEPEQPEPAQTRPDGGEFPEELYALCDLLRDLEEVGAEYNRKWFGIKRLRWAARGIRRASVRLTQLRRQARSYRGELLEALFRGGCGILATARALMGRRRLDEEDFLPWRRELRDHRAEQDEVRAWATDSMLEEAAIVGMP